MNLLKQDVEECSDERHAEPGLDGFGDSMRGALEHVGATPSATSPDDSIIAQAQRRRDHVAAKRDAAEATRDMSEDPGTPTADTTHKRDASASSIGSVPIPRSTEAVHFPFRDIMRPTRPLKCAIAIGRRGPIIANPFQHRPGLKITANLDAGYQGTPSIKLNFSISKDGTDRNETYDTGHYSQFTVEYEPGILIFGTWMIEDLQWARATVGGDTTFPTDVRNLCKAPQEEDSLYVLSYTVNSHRATRYSEDWLGALAGVMEARELENVDATMNKMLKEVGASYHVRLWFGKHRSNTAKVSDDDLVSFEERCLKPLEFAVMHHLRPLHQYRDGNGDPAIYLDMPTIKQVGNGMYLRHNKTKGSGTAGQTVGGKFTSVTLPKKMTWEQIEDFHIYNGVSVVRQHAFKRDSHAKIESDLHGVFLEKLPVFQVDGIEIGAYRKLWVQSFWAGVRLAPDNHRQKNSSPPEGTIMKMDFNADPDLPGYDGEEWRDQLWYGRVELRPKELLKQAGVDFWVLVSMPACTNAKPPSFEEIILVPDGKLPKARISASINPTRAKTELKALAKFCNVEFEPELLGEIRLGLMSDPNRNTNVNYGDLTWGPKGKESQANKDLWDDLMVEYAHSRTNKLNQMEVLRSPEKMRSNLVTCNGPLGAGMTNTLSDMIIALAKIGHTVLCVASTNAIVNLDARTVYRALGEEGQKRCKCLRLESDDAEQAATISKVNDDAYNGADTESNFARAQYNESTKVVYDPLTRNALEKIAIQYAEVEAKMDHYLEQYKTIEEAYAKVQHDHKLRKSNGDVGMTLDYQIWEVTREDKQTAEADYQALRQRLGEVESSRQFTAGEISEAKFDKSAVYRECVANYIDKCGKLSQIQREQFEAASDAMVSRVLARTNILFTTASNAGGKLLENGATFKPTVIICDNAGRISVPSLCVPLVCFNTWEGLFLFGDPNKNNKAAGRWFNEFHLNATLSPLALLTQKGFPGLFLY